MMSGTGRSPEGKANIWIMPPLECVGLEQKSHSEREIESAYDV